MAIVWNVTAERLALTRGYINPDEQRNVDVTQAAEASLIADGALVVVDGTTDPPAPTTKTVPVVTTVAFTDPSRQVTLDINAEATDAEVAAAIAAIGGRFRGAYASLTSGAVVKANDVVTNPSGALVSRIADGTISGSYNPANWTALSAGSSGLTPTAVKTANYTAVASDLVRVDTTSGPVTVTLPAAASGVTIGVKLVTVGGSNAVTIAAAGSDVFNKAGGVTTLSLSLLNQGVVLAAISGVWVVQADDLALSQLDSRFGSAAAVTAATAAAAAAQASVASTALGQSFGLANGVAVPPWQTPPTIGPELAVVSNLHSSFNTTLPIPSLVGNGTAKNNRTLISLGNLANKDLSFRVKLTVASMPTTTGWATVRCRIVDSGGTALTGSNEQLLITAANPVTGAYEFDFKVNKAWTVGTNYLEVRLDLFNNVAGGDGTLQVTGLSVKQVAIVQRPMLYTESYLGAPGFVQLAIPIFDPINEKYRMAILDTQSESALAVAFRDITGYSTDRPFRYDPLDPDFLAATVANDKAVNQPEIVLAAGEISRSLRINNNDQIMVVQKADLSYEYRGNTHGGETLRSTSSPNLVYQVDQGSGWATWNGLGKALRPCRRFQLVFNTKLTRSAPDSDDFANVDHTLTVFPDGVMRMDRTTTFLKAVRISQLFEWMSSHDITVGALGRIGAGSFLLDEVDAFPKLATPAAPTSAANNAAGALPAATYRYVITRLSEFGETDASAAVTQAVTGGTSTVTLTLPATVTGQTGWRVYGRANDAARMVLLTTLGPTATTWADDYSLPASGSRAPEVNTARVVDQSTVDTDAAGSDKATWAVWYDPAVNLCIGNIYDRDSVLARSGIAGTKVRLESVPASIRKNYQTVHWTDDGTEDMPTGTTHLTTIGEAWTATHWTFVYCPSDKAQYHREIAARASNLSAMRTLYPAT